MARTDIEALARQARESLCLGISPDAAAPLHRLMQPLRLETTSGLLTTRTRPCPSFPHQIWAMTTFEGGEACIWLNVEAWPELRAGVPRTRFSLAHELGHVMMHRAEVEDLFERAELDHTDAMERQANQFAAELLMPCAAFPRLGADDLRVDRLAARFGVSAPMAGRRVRECL